jgi:hypothetical protein
MAVNMSQIKDLLLPGLRAVTGEYRQIETEYTNVFEMSKSNMEVERTASVQFLGYAQLKNEGGPTTFDNTAGQRFVYNQIHQEIGLGYAITRKAIDDNLYKSQFRPSNLGLQRSFAQTKENYGAAVFNQGTTFNQQVGGDGVALFSTAHPLGNGQVVANKPTTEVDLAETSLLAGMIAIRTTWLDNAGLKMYARAKQLLIPPALEPVAIRLTRSELRPGTANNEVNAILSTSGGLKNGYTINDYLTSPFPWFLITETPGLIYMERVPFETDMQVDFTTDNLLVKGYERYSFGYYDWRNVYGTFPTS